MSLDWSDDNLGFATLFVIGSFRTPKLGTVKDLETITNFRVLRELELNGVRRMVVGLERGFPDAKLDERIQNLGWQRLMTKEAVGIITEITRLMRREYAKGLIDENGRPYVSSEPKQPSRFARNGIPFNQETPLKPAAELLSKERHFNFVEGLPDNITARISTYQSNGKLDIIVAVEHPDLPAMTDDTADTMLEAFHKIEELVEAMQRIKKREKELLDAAKQEIGKALQAYGLHPQAETAKQMIADITPTLARLLRERL